MDEVVWERPRTEKELEALLRSIDDYCMDEYEREMVRELVLLEWVREEESPEESM